MLLSWGVMLAAVVLRSWQGPQLGLEQRDCLTFGVFTAVFGRIGMLLPGLLPPGGEAVLLGDAPLCPSFGGGAVGVAAGALLFFLLFGRNPSAYAALYLPLAPLLWWWAGELGWRLCAVQVLILLFCAGRNMRPAGLALVLAFLVSAGRAFSLITNNFYL